jgi:hypothetical protein
LLVPRDFARIGLSAFADPFAPLSSSPDPDSSDAERVLRPDFMEKCYLIAAGLQTARRNAVLTGEICP